MPDAINHKINTLLKSAIGKHITAEYDGIFIYPPLSEVLQRFARARIATQSNNLAPQIVSKSRAAPAKCFSDCCADRRFPAANLSGEAEEDTHAKSNAIWRERSDTQPRRSRLSQLTGAIETGASSSIRVA